MAITVKVSEWGNSLAIRLPKAVVDQLGLKAGGEAELTLQNDRVEIHGPKTESRKRYEAMIAEMKRLMAEGVPEPELVDWGPPLGDEKLPDEDWTEEFDAWKKTKNAG